MAWNTSKLYRLVLGTKLSQFYPRGVVLEEMDHEEENEGTEEEFGEEDEQKLKKLWTDLGKENMQPYRTTNKENQEVTQEGYLSTLTEEDNYQYKKESQVQNHKEEQELNNYNWDLVAKEFKEYLVHWDQSQSQ